MILGKRVLSTKWELLILRYVRDALNCYVIAYRNTESSDKTEQRKRLRDHRTLEKSLCEAFLLGCDLNK